MSMSETKHGLGITCEECKKVIPLPDDVVEDIASLDPGEKFKYKCTHCDNNEHEMTPTYKERMEAARDYPGSHGFCHLHTHTIYSSLDGVAIPQEYFIACNECDLKSFAITDHGSIASSPDSYFAAKSRGVKYINACEVYFNDFDPEFREWRKQARAGNIEYVPFVDAKEHTKFTSLRASAHHIYLRFQRNRHLIVLPKNMNGYRNLVKIQNIAWEKGFYYQPRVWYDLLREYKEDLIITTACLNGVIAHELREEVDMTPVSSTIRKRLKGNPRYDEERGMAPPKLVAVEWVKQLKEDFGDDFYLELQMPGESIPKGRMVFRMIAEMGRKMGVKCVLTNDAHYMSREDFHIQMVMMATAQDKKIDDPTFFHVNSDEQFFKTRAQLRKYFIEHEYDKYASIEEFEEYCDNTLEIADKCEDFKPDLRPKLPEVNDANRELTKKTLEALKAKGLEKDSRYVNRMKTELKRFIEKEFSSYFLITADICNESRRRGWPIGPARGSAGGSLVCWLLGIHEMDPIEWDLSFDRFLSESRGGYMLNVSM